MALLIAALLLYSLTPEVQTNSTSSACPAPASGKIPDKCQTCFNQILKQINKTNVLSSNTMYGFANYIGTYVQQWIQNRTSAGNKAVPTMCEIGNAIKDYVSAHLQQLISCVGQYNQGTAAQVAVDVTSISLVMGQYNLDEIADGATCGAMECLEGAYKTDFTTTYKAWVANKANYTTIQNQVCKLCADYVSQMTLIQKCFNNIKARTRVPVLLNLYDKYIPHYIGLYQHYRDTSTVACMTKPLICGCNMTVTATANQAVADYSASG